MDKKKLNLFKIILSGCLNRENSDTLQIKLILTMNMFFPHCVMAAHILPSSSVFWQNNFLRL